MPDLTRPRDPVQTPLSQIVAALGATVIGDLGATTVTGLSLSTERLRRGDLFAALPGTRVHGARFAATARAAGAVAVLTDEAGAADAAASGLPVLVVSDPRGVLGALAARVYGDPARSLTMLAVTGTQGKTTTTRLLDAALTNAGVPVAVIGTLGTRVLDKDVATELTTPEAPDLHALFAVMRERGVGVCAMEVSSHALVLGRVDGVVFDVAAFLNLGRDHLDFHADMDSYFAAKAALFTPRHSRRGLVNIDDAYGRRLLAEAAVPLATFSGSGADADWRAQHVVTGADGSAFEVVTPAGDVLAAQVHSPGAFNVDNALAAIALAGEAGLDPRLVAENLGAVAGVPGRFERVDAGQPFAAVVDYAHKPDALAAALRALRPVTSGRLVVVIGAGGDRDRGKRSLMGETGARFADVVVVTDDNPRSEDPAEIRAALLAGATAVPMTDRADVIEIGDRAAAIRHAVSLAGPGDTVLVAGKGHETGQEIGAGSERRILPFDDREELRAALEAWS